jgi:hypothetical protein
LWIRVFYGIQVGGLHDGRRPAGASGLTQFRPSVALRLLGRGRRAVATLYCPYLDQEWRNGRWPYYQR